MPISRFVRQWFPSEQRTVQVNREERTLAVLVGARALIERGWMQDGWYVMEAPDGGRLSVGAGSPTRRDYGTVVQACLVGAVVEAATRHSPEPWTAGSALDALWRTLLTAEGRPVDSGRRVPSPEARGVEVRELTRWNDRRGRTQEDVLRLLDVTIGNVGAARSIEAAEAAPAGVPVTV